MVFKIRTSKKTMTIFEEISARTNYPPFILSKLSISMSIKSGEPLTEADFKTDNFGLELNRQTITGEWDALYKGLIAENPLWTLCDIYLDFRSGSTIAGRTEFMRLLEDASNRKFDIVLCKSISRFGRNVIEALQVIKELHRSGVHVIFEQESLDSSNPEHTLLISLMSSIAEAENENRRQNVNWGMQRRLENGTSRLYSRPCYGYENDSDGELIINEQQAEVVRLVFSMYLSGKSVVGIIASLYEQRIPSPTGKERWSKHTIEVMLDNRKYTGDVVILKKYTDTSATDAAGSYITYLATASHPAIITREQFAQVQTERERRSNIVVDETGRHRKNSKYSSKKAMQKGSEPCEESILPQS